MALDGSHAGDGDPLAVRLDEVLACRMAGISVVDAVTFVEREAGRIDLELLTPAWLALTRGFGRRGLERAVKRVLDVLLGVLLLVLSTPLMVLALIWALIGRGVTLARETCIGLDGCAFQRLTLDVAGTGRIRRLLRGLPQLLHVLAGTMSLVGPSPVSTDEWARLSAELVFWGERRNLRPGILGWAQLNCGAGEAEKDAVEKLQYDLYYLKNHTLLLDLAILVQAAQMLVFSRNG
jgi:lipopolysaccharide/colanic/teichoic acid biosynthesis glycosyltransferase